MRANKGAAGLYSFTSPPDGAPDATAAAEPSPIGGARGLPRPRGWREVPAAAGDSGAQRTLGTAGPRGDEEQRGPVWTAHSRARESRPARSGEWVGDRERRENSGCGPWERQGRALFAGCASSRRIEAACGVLCPVLVSSARERSYWS